MHIYSIETNNAVDKGWIRIFSAGDIFMLMQKWHSNKDMPHVQHLCQFAKFRVVHHFLGDKEILFEFNPDR